MSEQDMDEEENMMKWEESGANFVAKGRNGYTIAPCAGCSFGYVLWLGDTAVGEALDPNDLKVRAENLDRFLSTPVSRAPQCGDPDCKDCPS